MNILLVEDEAAVRSVLVRALRRNGYAVYAFAGTEPVDLSVVPRVDVLVTDIGLPAESGAALAARARARWPQCEVILMSGHAAEELRRKGIGADADVLEKPFAMSELTDLVELRLRQRSWRSLRVESAPSD